MHMVSQNTGRLTRTDAEPKRMPQGNVTNAGGKGDEFRIVEGAQVVDLRLQVRRQRDLPRDDECGG